MIQPVQTNTCIIYLLKVKNKYKQIITEKKLKKYDKVPGVWLLRLLEPRGDSRWLYRGIIRQRCVILIWLCCQLVNYVQFILDTKYTFFWQSERIENTCISSTYLKKSYIYITLHIEWTAINAGCTVALHNQDHRPLYFYQ